MTESVPGADPPPVRLRPAVRADLPMVMAVERLSFASPWTERMFSEELANDWSSFWVAEETDPPRVSGFMVFWRAYDEIHLLNIAVAPERRRHGVARAMMDGMLGQARAHAASHVLLEVRPSNLAALRLYQGLGFRPVSVRPRYYADNGEDAIVMVKTLVG